MTSIGPPEAEFVFMDGFQIGLQNHQRQGQFSTLVSVISLPSSLTESKLIHCWYQQQGSCRLVGLMKYRGRSWHKDYSGYHSRSSAK
jgi:hypothetical protein